MALTLPGENIAEKWQHLLLVAVTLDVNHVTRMDERGGTMWVQSLATFKQRQYSHCSTAQV